MIIKYFVILHKMNRIEKRISDTRPGAPVYNPENTNSTIGMLGGSSYLYQRRRQSVNKQSDKQTSQSTNRNNTKKINGVAILKNQGDRLKRLENKLEQIEKNQAITSSNIDLINDKTTTKIELMNGSYKKQMLVMKNYIKELELKIIELESNKPITVKAVKKTTTNQENISLEILEKN